MYARSLFHNIHANMKTLIFLKWILNVIPTVAVGEGWNNKIKTEKMEVFKFPAVITTAELCRFFFKITNKSFTIAIPIQLQIHICLFSRKDGSIKYFDFLRKYFVCVIRRNCLLLLQILIYYKMSEDEDYMSDAFLAKLDDVRPGLKRVGISDCLLDILFN